MSSRRPAYTWGDEVLVRPPLPRQGPAHGGLTLHRCLCSESASVGRKRAVTDAHTVAACGLAYVSAGGCALELPSLDCASAPPTPHALF